MRRSALCSIARRSIWRSLASAEPELAGPRGPGSDRRGQSSRLGRARGRYLRRSRRRSRLKYSLAPAALPNHALRTTLRMMLALGVSLVFTFTYGMAAANSRRAEMVMVPLLDVLQSVSLLGYLSFTAVFLVSLKAEQGARY